MLILGATLDSELTFETHLWKDVSKAARNLGIVRRAGKLFDCPRVLKGCFYTYASSNWEYCAPSFMESHLLFDCPRVPPVSRRRRNLIWVVRVRKGCVRVSFVVWGTEGRLQCLVFLL